LTYRRQADKLQGLKNLRRKHVTERSYRGDNIQDLICYNLFVHGAALDRSIGLLSPLKGESFVVAIFKVKYTFHGEGVTTLTNQN
jgi:hypothetical protein